MTDFTLSDGDSIIIGTDTTIDNFYYKGGKIDVPPGKNFYMNGEFIFCPTSSADQMGTVYKGLIARIEIESGNNGIFNKFLIYDLYPENKPLFFPCIVFGRTDDEEEVTQNLFGGDIMIGTTIVCDLAFKSSEIRTIGAINVTQKDLANYYLDKMRDVLKSIKFESSAVNIGNFEEKSSIQEPQESNQSLWGFAMEISFDYKSINA